VQNAERVGHIAELDFAQQDQIFDVKMSNARINQIEAAAAGRTPGSFPLQLGGKRNSVLMYAGSSSVLK